MRIDVARLARRVLVLVGLSFLPALALTASSGWPSGANVASHASSSGFEGIRLENVAGRVGLNFRQGAFRFGVSPDPAAMTGGGLCALDYDNDGWVDLFVVNSFSEADFGRWRKRGGLPRSALFRNTKGRFTDVSRRSKASLATRGEGCVAADLNSDGRTDLYISTAGYDKLLWNNGDGTFTQGARAAGIRRFGWHAGAAVGDVNGDGRPDLYVAGYADPNVPVPGSAAGFPNNVSGVRDLLYLNVGRDRKAHPKFREVGVQAGLEAARFDHSLGAVFSDFDDDGRLDLYVANDGDPNRLYQNVAWPGGRKADPGRARLPLRGARGQRRSGRPERRDGSRGGGLHRRRAHRPIRLELARPGPRGLRPRARPSRPDRRSTTFEPAFAPAFGSTFTGLGRSPGSTSTWTPTPTSCSLTAESP